MARERRIRYTLLWALFVAVMLTGAGLLLSPDAARQAWGLALLVLPLALLLILTTAYYLLERFRAMR